MQDGLARSAPLVSRSEQELHWLENNQRAHRPTRLGREHPLILLSFSRGWASLADGAAISRTGLFVTLVAVTAALNADPARSAEVSDRYGFDIPSKSLPAALGDYSAVTGIGVLVDGRTMAGRLSAPIKGTFSSSDALEALLAKSGLSPRFVSRTAFTLIPASPESRTGSDIARAAYFAAVQTAVVRALCERAETRPGRYRSAVQLWIDQSGFVQRLELLGSSGKPARDVAISEVLGHLTIDALPTFSLPQPITVALSPHDSDRFDDCSPADRTLRR
jgi:hypothetical protein